MALPKKLSKALWMIGIPAGTFAAYWLVFMSPLPFSASWWDVDTEKGTTFKTRYRVADRLAASGRLDDMTREEVIALLGAPVTDVTRLGKHDLIYVLGPERGLISVDYEWLLIDLDPLGKVAKVEVASD
jgi:hypothetical protein